jgi:hypothetical protein
MRVTRRKLLGATSAVGTVGLANSLFHWSPFSEALAQTPEVVPAINGAVA